MSKSIPETSPLGCAAVALATNGWRVFPLKPGGKEPAIYGWPQRASADPQTVAALWRSRPHANIGLVTGNGTVVIDVDTQHGGEINPDWPDTLTVSTPSDGWHFYYACDAPVRNSVGKLAPGVDVRGDGGYVVAPCSVFDDGRGWQWVDDGPIAHVDASLFTISDNMAPRASGGMSAQRFVPREHVGAGERNAYLASAAGWMYAQGSSHADVEIGLHAENECVCHPPLDADEVASIAASVARYHQ
jgi:hypothetical protein